MSSHLPISVCILCKNEEDRLDACLGVLMDFQEVIVMDTGSCDTSIEKIKSYPFVTLYEEEWQGFASSRRSLFQKAKQNWVLWLDADEVVSEELIAEMKSLFCSEPTAVAYEINRMVHFEGQWVKHGLWFPDWNCRLFKQGHWEMPQREVHESIEVQGLVSRLNGLIYHYTYRDWEDQKKRSSTYAALWAQQKRKEGKSSTLVKAWVHSSWTFFRAYILKKGCLDGWLGLKIAWAVSREVRMKHGLLSCEAEGLSS